MGNRWNEDKEAEAVKYKRVEIPTDDILKEKTRSLDCWQREVVNIGIRFAKDIVKARRHPNSRPKAPLYMIHGGAGAGKSAVIEVLAPWMQKILQQEGNNIECPCVVKTAFTGCAASNIDGQTLHGTFGFSFDNNHYSLSDKSRDQKRVLMKWLKEERVYVEVDRWKTERAMTVEIMMDVHPTWSWKPDC